MQTARNLHNHDTTYDILADQYKKRERVIELELHRKKQAKEEPLFLDHTNPFWPIFFAVGMIAFAAMLFWIGDLG